MILIYYYVKLILSKSIVGNYYEKFLYSSTVIAVLLFAIFYVAFKFTQNDILQILYITFMTFSYHFVMRLVVGLGIGKVHPKEFDYRAKWFQPRPFEKKLYKAYKQINLHITCFFGWCAFLYSHIKCKKYSTFLTVNVEKNQNQVYNKS